MKKFLAGIVVGLALVPMGMQAAITLFRDVNPDDWYGPAVSRLQEHGIVNGYQDGTFQPHREVSRAELAVIIDRVLHTVDPEYAAQSGENLMEITLFFTDRDVAIERDCSATKAVQRMVPQTTAIADAALRELLAGVTPDEETMGVTDSFSNDTGSLGADIAPLTSYYEGVSISNGIATVAFTEQAMVYLNSAACLQQSVKSPIVQTLRQFPSVSDVQFSVGGRVVTEWDA
ncbi:MAG TPA: S-layer homology domain-containing protein [Candidatus Peribacteraceae bacterium]|nr:S-layer homology domain-containing protein [Candidatus Peribacteraceae bacterium]